jgi:predicted esterase
MALGDEVTVVERNGSGVCGQLWRTWLALGLALPLARCVPPRAAGDDELFVTQGVAPARVDLSALSLAPGDGEYDVPVAGQGQRSLEIWMPEHAAPRTLVLMLHGTVVERHGVVGPAARRHTRPLIECLAAPALGPLDPIIIAPRSETGQWWLKEDTELVLGLAEAVQERWPGTRGRSVIAGYSNGGIGTWFFARLYAPYFSAAIPMAFNESIVGRSPLPIYAIQGSLDEQFDIVRVRGAVEALKAQGQDVTFDEKYRGSHLQACSYAPELANAGQWLEAHAFSKQQPSSASGD